MWIYITSNKEYVPNMFGNPRFQPIWEKMEVFYLHIFKLSFPIWRRRAIW